MLVGEEEVVILGYSGYFSLLYLIIEKKIERNKKYLFSKMTKRKISATAQQLYNEANGKSERLGRVTEKLTPHLELKNTRKCLNYNLSWLSKDQRRYEEDLAERHMIERPCSTCVNVFN